MNKVEYNDLKKKVDDLYDTHVAMDQLVDRLEECEETIDELQVENERLKEQLFEAQQATGTTGESTADA